MARMSGWATSGKSAWIVELSKRFNAALRHSVGCVRDNRNHLGLPCDEAGWVNVESILKYDAIWKDQHTLAGTAYVNYPILVERWNNFQRVIFTEYKQTKRNPSTSARTQGHER